MLNHRFGIRLGLEEVLYAYIIRRQFHQVLFHSLQLVVNLPNTNKNKPQGKVMLLGSWGCARDLMLQEFGMNLDLELDQGSGHGLTWHFLFVCYVLLCR